MESHFLVRYSFAGIVLFIFWAIGVWLVDEPWFGQLATSKDAGSIRTLVAAAAAAPIIGVTIHGIVVRWSYRRHGHSFNDWPREQIATRYREAATEFAPRSPLPLSHIPPGRVRAGLITRMINQVANRESTSENFIDHDSIFVFLYYHNEKEYLIEWARRRRSYYLLGVSWSIAAIAGLTLGTLAGLSHGWAHHARFQLGDPVRVARATIVLLSGGAWIYVSAWLGLQMKEDADGMEWTWCKAFLEGPALKGAKGAEAIASAAPAPVNPAAPASIPNPP